MQVTRKSRLYLRLQNILFVVLFITAIGIFAWLSTRYNYHADWTAGARNTLSPASQAVLAGFDERITITAYARETVELRRHISELVARYQRYKPAIELSFVNPDHEPERVRELGISADGELVIAYAKRNEKLRKLNEQGLTNALQRLAHTNSRWLVFLSGHGERNPHGIANHDLSNWVRHLESKGLVVQTINLIESNSIPDNTGVLVIAGPQVDLLPGEVMLIQRYIDQGGNLLWLSDPGALHGLEPTSEQLGIEFQAGVIVDPTTRLLGLDRPEFTLVASYPAHPITRNLNTPTLFPVSSGIDLQPPAGWHGKPFLVTQAGSWSETAALEGEGKLDKGGNIQGPFNIGVSLVREPDALPNRAGHAQGAEQRIVVTGDADFLSNTYLGNGGNLDLGLNIINWLSQDDRLIAIGARTAPDITLTLTRSASLVIAFGFLFILPLTLLATGLVIWLRRRNR